MDNININLLKKLDLNETEIKVYKSILESGDVNMNVIAGLSSVPTNRVYDVSKGLYDKGFLIKVNHRPLRFIAINPEDVIAVKRDQLAKDLTELAGKLSEIWEVKSRRTNELNFTLNSHGSILSQCKSLACKSEEIIKMNLGTFSSYLQYGPSIFKKLDKKTHVQILTDHDVGFREENITIKKIKQVDMQYIIFDSKDVVLLIEKIPGDIRGIFVSDENLAKVLSSKFDKLWSSKK